MIFDKEMTATDF